MRDRRRFSGPQRESTVNHDRLVRDDSGEDFLLFTFWDVEVIERTANLHAHFVEFLGLDVEMPVSFAEFLAPYTGMVPRTPGRATGFA